MKSLDLSSELLNVLPQAMRVIRGEMRGLAQPELTVAQFRILTRLTQGAHTNKQLAEWMGISAASMCRTVDVLFERELVARQVAKSDRREVAIELTKKGRKKYESIARSTKGMLQKKISCLSLKDQHELLVGLAHIKRVFFK